MDGGEVRITAKGPGRRRIGESESFGGSNGQCIGEPAGSILCCLLFPLSCLLSLPSAERDLLEWRKL